MSTSSSTYSEHSNRSLLFFGTIAFALLASTILLFWNSVFTADAAEAQPAFSYDFRVDGVLDESTSASESWSSYWWLQSGGQLVIEDGVGKTLEGALPMGHRFRLAYASAYPETSDNGFHPQNLFRLFTQDTWEDARYEATFHLKDANLFNSYSTKPWNGIFLAARYSGGDFYVAGLRMDGTAVIKKKRSGAYTTLVQERVLSGSYDRVVQPNLLPMNETITLQLVTETNADGSVALSLARFDSATGSWKTLAQATDGSDPIRSAGRLGIFSDYLEISIDDVEVYEMQAGTTASADPVSPDPAPSDPIATLTGTYGLSNDSTVVEAGSMGNSASPDWWVNSGAYFFVENGVGSTIHGALSSNDPWFSRYASANSLDTDAGAHPQNIFRLVSKETRENVSQEGYFKISDYHESASPNRAGHNGILFLSRYHDGDNLYYTGVRVDGKAIIKKKVNGTYYTLGSNTVFSGSYSRSSNPNLIPENTWIGIKSVVRDTADGVAIDVYLDKSGNGNWELAVSALDDGSRYGRAITGAAHAGVRTDFMDVSFKEYRLEER